MTHGVGQSGQPLLRFKINKPTCVHVIYSGTSPLGHLNSGTTKFGPGKMFFVHVTAIEGTPLFRGKGPFF